MMMKKYMCLALLVICFAFSHALGDDAFPLKAKRVLFLGDSITNAGHYVSDIETQLRLQGISPLPEIINIGLSSETCSGLSEPDHPFPRPDVHERLDRALDKARPDVVVACYGMNDGIYYPFSEERFAAYKAGVRKLVNKVHTSGAKIVLMTPPPFDPSPLKGKEGKLLPAGAEKYAWFAIYENYDDVIQRYAEWVMQNDAGADMVVNVHQPISDFLKEQRERDPGFSMANDGVHMDARGHRVMAKAILNAWGLDSWKEPSPELQKLVQQRERVLHAAWLSHIGHKRPGVKEGLPLADAVANAAELDAKITPLVPAGK